MLPAYTKPLGALRARHRARSRRSANGLLSAEAVWKLDEFLQTIWSAPLEADRVTVSY
jgi:hypothetical protein